MGRNPSIGPIGWSSNIKNPESQPRPELVVRTAQEDDNDALLELAAACPMEGEIGLCVDRSPDFFAINRLAGHSWWLLVAEVEGEIAGCVGTATRDVYWQGEPATSFYLMDLKVHARYRGLSRAVADRLIRAMARRCRREGGEDRITINTVLTGNAAGEIKTTAPRGGPHAGRYGSLNAWSIPLLLPLMGGRLWGTLAQPATLEDIPEMMDLWSSWAPDWQFAPAFTRDPHDGHELDPEEAFLRRITACPGLGLENHILLRRRKDNRLLGFWGLWDQSAIQQMRVTAYTSRLLRLRRLYNFVGRLTHGPRLPEPGGELGCLVAVHTCTPADRPEILRALLAHAMAERRGAGYAVLNVGLDVRDPRARALRGLFAQPTQVDIYASTSNGRPYDGPRDERLVHHEISLV